MGTAALLLDTLHISCSICNIGRHCRVQTRVPDYPNSQLQTLHNQKLHLRTIYGHSLPLHVRLELAAVPGLKAITHAYCSVTNHDHQGLAQDLLTVRDTLEQMGLDVGDITENVRAV